MHHGTCVTHVPWCMSGSLTCGDRENVPGIPGACAPAILRIWQEAHGIGCDILHSNLSEMRQILLSDIHGHIVNKFLIRINPATKAMWEITPTPHKHKSDGTTDILFIKPKPLWGNPEETVPSLKNQPNQNVWGFCENPYLLLWRNFYK